MFSISDKFDNKQTFRAPVFHRFALKTEDVVVGNISIDFQRLLCSCDTSS